jgi:hypothetical protein
MRRELIAAFVIVLFSAEVFSLPQSTPRVQPRNPFLESIKRLAGVKTSQTLPALEQRFDAAKQKNAILNINRHVAEVAKLRASGKSLQEIVSYFNFKRATIGTGSITGAVYESNGATPVQNPVSIEAFDEFGQFAGSIFMLFGDVTYTIDNLETGKYYVRTFSFDRVYVNEYYDDVTDWREATLVEVTDGQVTSGVNFALLQKASENGAITGTVTAAGGQPIAFECAVAAIDEDMNFVDQGTTDGQGNYLIDGLATGIYRLVTFYFGQENLADEWYENATSFETATPVSVIDPDTTRDRNFTLEPGGLILGKVVNPQGQPFDQSAFILYLYDLQFNLAGNVVNIVNDSFIIPRLASGGYKLFVRYNGAQNYLETWYDGAEDFASANTITVAAPDTTKDIIVTLPAGGAIAGSVRDPNGLPVGGGMVVTAFDEDGGFVSSDEVSGGTYTILRLPIGRYKLFARFTAGTPFTSQPANEWYNGADDFQSAQAVEVPGPVTVSGINFRLRQGRFIQGQVFTPQGLPLDNSAFVQVFNSEGAFVTSADVGSNGTYLAAGLLSGAYKLRIRDFGLEDYYDEWYNGKPTFTLADPIMVTAPNGVMNVNFTLQSPSRLNGFVSDQDGNRLSDEEEKFVDLFVYDAGNGSFIDFGFNSFNGGYEIDLLPGTYKLAAVTFASNLAAFSDSLAVVYYENGQSFDEPATQTISLGDNAALTLNELRLPKVNGAIAGTIQSGAPPSPLTDHGYILFATDPLGYVVKVSIFSPEKPIDGQYLITGLRPGIYYLLASVFIESQDDQVFFQWFGGVDVNYNVDILEPKFAIPSGALPIVVQEGLVSDKDFFFDLTTGINEPASGSSPFAFQLRQNYPNPFNPETTIEYELPEAAHVEIQVYNIMGNRVATLVNQKQISGEHSVKWNAAGFSSGVYFVGIKAGNYQNVKKCLLLK